MPAERLRAVSFRTLQSKRTGDVIRVLREAIAMVEREGCDNFCLFMSGPGGDIKHYTIWESTTYTIGMLERMKASALEEAGY